MKCINDQEIQQAATAKPPDLLAPSRAFLRRLAVTGERRATANTRPLLRGIITGIGGWQRLSADADYEEQWGHLSVWCPSCAVWHYHGWAISLDGRWAQHRCAHCPHSSDFYESGYWISVLRQPDPGYAAHVIKPGTLRVRRRASR